MLRVTLFTRIIYRQLQRKENIDHPELRKKKSLVERAALNKLSFQIETLSKTLLLLFIFSCEKVNRFNLKSESLATTSRNF